MKKINRGITGWLMVIAFFVAPMAMAQDIVVSAGGDAEMQQAILQYVNEYRAKRHLAPLEMNQTVSAEATQHSRAMASHSVPFGHAHFDGRIKRLYRQFDPSQGGAENVAYYKWDAKRLVDQWISSSGHRQNIVGNYNVTGIGIAHDKKGWAYYTQIFLRADAREGQHAHPSETVRPRQYLRYGQHAHRSRA